MSRFLKDSSIILAVSLLLTALIVRFNLDATLAVSLYDPDNTVAWWLRQYSQLPGTVISVVCLVYLLTPPLKAKWPHVSRIALIWLLGLIIGGGVVVHAFLKEVVDRPRPRETILLGGDIVYYGTLLTRPAELQGKSFPSGHVAMASAFLLLFFAWRHHRYAWAMLTFGLGYAALVSWARMTLGAHFLSDCLWATSVMMVTGSATSSLVAANVTVKARYIAGFLAVCLFCVVWWNKFTLQLSYQGQDTTITSIDLPCTPIITPVDEPDFLQLNVTLSGYGAPLSWLTLSATDQTLSLTRHIGIYRDLACDAVLIIDKNHPLIEKMS